MQIPIKQVATIGKCARLVRKQQAMDQFAIASMSDNGTTFLSDFENGKPTVELGRVLKVLDALGIHITLDLPIKEDELTATQKKQLREILDSIS